MNAQELLDNTPTAKNNWEFFFPDQQKQELAIHALVLYRDGLKIKLKMMDK